MPSSDKRRDSRVLTERAGGLQFTIRAYQPGDEHAICDLFPQVFDGKKMPPATWQWKYRHNPGGRTLATTCWLEDGTLVAHYAAIPLPAQVLERPGILAQSCDSMAHPKYRAALMGRNGIFVRTAKAFFRMFGDPEDRLLTYGFAGTRHLRLGRLLLGYVTLCDVEYYLRPLELSRWRRWRMRRATFPGVRRVGSFSPEADSLWAHCRKQHPTAVVRDSRYLNWRYRDHPSRRYAILALVTGNGRWLAWVVAAVEDGIGRLVDMLLPAPPPDAVPTLLEAAVAWCAGQGARAVEAWCPSGAPGRHILELCGFARAPDPNDLTYTVGPQNPDFPASDAAGGLYYQMGDADIY